MTSLYQGFLKNIAHNRYYHHFIVSCICVFVLLYFHLWLLRTSFLRSMYRVLSENIAHDEYYCTLSFHVFAYTLYLCICITVFSEQSVACVPMRRRGNKNLCNERKPELQLQVVAENGRRRGWTMFKLKSREGGLRDVLPYQIVCFF